MQVQDKSLPVCPVFASALQLLADMVQRFQRVEAIDPMMCHCFTGPFLKAVSDRMQWLTRTVNPDGSTVIGVPALLRLLKELQTRFDKKDDTPLTYQDVDHVARYKHLLDAEGRKQLTAIRERVAERQARMAASAMPAKKKRKVSHGDKKSAASAAQAPVVQLAGMFD